MFLRLLGFVYFVAFASLAPQLAGLIGSDGLLPAAGYLERAYDLWGRDAYVQLPTLLWIWPGDALLTVLCWLGIALSAAAMAGVAPIATFAALWAVYLSVTVAGQDFPVLPVGPAVAGDRLAGRALRAAGLVAAAGNPGAGRARPRAGWSGASRSS